MELSSSIIPETVRCPHSAAGSQVLVEDIHKSGALPRTRGELPEYRQH